MDPALGAPEDRSIRVFLSSTFRDMQAEREELVKQVLPMVRAACELRGVAFSEVDLRWGVSDVQKAEGAVLPICLAEIERSRPYFIGMLGDRYGWVPDELPGALTEQLGWLTEDVGRSVTELEILHGVLRAPDAAGHAYFYLRQPAYLDTVPAEERGELVEASEAGRRRLVELKDRVRASGHPCRDYDDPRHLGQLVLDDLLSLLDERFPADAVPDRWARTRAEHAAHGAARHGVHVDRPAELAVLDAHAAGDGPPLYVTAPSGGGASALVTRWAAGRSGAVPEVPVVVHHVDATGESADWAALVARVLVELGAVADEDTPGPATPAAARAALTAAARGLTDAGRRAVVVLDGLAALDDRDGAPDLVWLPADLPAGLRLVATGPDDPVGPGSRAVAAALARGWAFHAVAPLDANERRAVAELVLAQGAKALDGALLDALATAPGTGNPLYLRTVLDELRQHGDHFTLGEVLARLLAAPDLHALMGLLLDRWEHDFERDRPGLVGEVLGLLTAARHGLEESELLDLLGGGRADDPASLVSLASPVSPASPLPYAVWSPLHLAAEAHLVRRSGLLAPGHAALRRAIEGRWLAEPAARGAVHARLSAYFGSRFAGPRTLDELPWACVGAGEWDRLVGCLADGPFLLALTRRDPLAPRRLWQLAEAPPPAGGGRSMATAYAGLHGGPAPDLAVAFTAGALLLLAGHLPAAIEAQEALVAGHRAGTDDAGLRAALVNLAVARFQAGEHEAAAVAGTEAAGLARAVGDHERLEPALNVSVLALTALHRRTEAMALSAEEEALCRTRDDPVALAGCLAARGAILRAEGDLDAALATFLEQERLNRLGGDPVGVAQALGAQAVVVGDRGDHAGAVGLILRQEEALREVGARAELTTAMLNRAWHLQATGEAATAAAVVEEAEAMARAAGRWSEVARVLVLRAGGFLASGANAEAEAAATEAADLARRIGDVERHGAALQVLVAVRRTVGDLAGAVAHLDEQERLYQGIGSVFGLANVAGGRGDVAAVAGDLAGAMAHWARAEAGYREVGEVANLRTLLSNRVQARQMLQDLEGLGSDLEALAAVSAALGDEVGRQAALGDRALLLLGRGDLVGAETVLDEQESICRRLGPAGLEGLQACVGNRAILRRQQGRYEEALVALDEQHALCTQLGNAQGSLICLANRGDVLAQLPGRAAEARACLEQARATAQGWGLVPMVAQLDQMLAALRPA